MSRTTFTAVRRLGQVGYIARGVVFLLVGILVIKAAIDHEPGQGRGLRRRAEEPGGGAVRSGSCWWLAGLGLVCFGAYCVAEARYRRL